MADEFAEIGDIDLLIKEAEAHANKDVMSQSFPQEFDYLHNPDAGSASFDDMLTEKCRSMAPEDAKPGHLLNFLGAEINELRGQKAINEVTNPKWLQQQAMVNEANNFFNNNPNEDMTDVSIQIDEKTGKVLDTSIGRVETDSHTYPFRTFDRQTFKDEYAQAFGFEEQDKALGKIRSSVVKIVAGEPLGNTDEEASQARERIESYLATKILRWEVKALHGEGKKQRDYLFSLKKQIHSYGNSEAEFENFALNHPKESTDPKPQNRRPPQKPGG